MSKYLTRCRDLIAAVVMLLIAAALFVLSFSVQRNTVSSIGPGFMPRLVAVLLLILGSLNLRDAVKASRAQPAPAAEEHAERRTPKEFFLSNLDWASAVLILLYVFLVGPLGFPVASALYMFFQMIVLSIGQKRNWILLVVLSLAVPAAVYFAFTKWFYLMLPAGILG